MSAHISKSKFKAKALEYFRKIEASGEPIIITEHGKPKLEIRRLPQQHANPRDKLKGSVLRYDDPFEPVGVDDWEALK
ncbi:MAG: type II toxin-antitoxin system Phd/YefM family antitoxin [Hyphomicrobiales bacterium]|nr:type II toxin-antitoxin system Phd/YefM family antitoxin [Hyphomicrobiales bacterium]